MDRRPFEAVSRRRGERRTGRDNAGAALGVGRGGRKGVPALLTGVLVAALDRLRTLAAGPLSLAAARRLRGSGWECDLEVMRGSSAT